eukprot:CAMPEP_0182564620 /NCGR_PEP_ID=MMETSP1324-20130603/6525_1 /TAXON_ID=236786 /ORGANISM="Florenciella sp., Strain RCC1587" /LENGTH=47 /DNA_ID= /DNA_START= /DNA_END= /DNA_ORIENTATION=
MFENDGLDPAAGGLRDDGAMTMTVTAEWRGCMGPRAGAATAAAAAAA